MWADLGMPLQVMARKMVNPDISLFHPVPEGALTYQPNPNSIVQVGSICCKAQHGTPGCVCLPALGTCLAAYMQLHGTVMACIGAVQVGLHQSWPVKDVRQAGAREAVPDG